MSDPDDILSGLRADPPRPEPAKRAADIAMARKNFDDLQGSRDTARQTSDRPKQGLIGGLKAMLTQLTTRGALTATTALAAVGLVALLPVLQSADLTAPRARVTETAPVVETEEAAAPEEMSADAAADMAAPQVSDRAAIPASPPPVAAPAPQLAAPQARVPQSTAKRAETAGIVAEPPLALESDAFAPLPEADTEAYPEASPNPLKVTAEEPVSTFSVDVDTASWSIVRSSLMRGQLPPEGAVRIEEMVNYFPYDYPAPEGDAAFATTLAVMETPWNRDTQLVRIAIQGALPALAERPPLNLVFLIDTSGSMDQPDKLPLLKQSFALMLSQLRPGDEVAIVTYAGSAGQVLAPTPAAERETILAALDRLGAGGSTAGQAGLQQAYAVARGMAAAGEVGRVILATDGDFNVGLSDPEALKDYIERQAEDGTYLSVLGFGRGNLDDATMQALAQNGNGTASYIDTLQEAQKVLVDQLSGALYPIADDVKIQVEWNPARIAEYRLLGYETRALRREDFSNDAVDAGEIGAGHQVTALYEVTPLGSPARRTDPLRYGAAPAASTDRGELGWLKLRHKAPGAEVSTLTETAIEGDAAEADTEARFAAAIAGMGQLLRDDSYLGTWGWDEAIALASGARGEDAFGYRAEAVRLMRLAQSLSR